MRKVITKGSCVMSCGIWYVVVNVLEDSVDCICDHANNIHNWTSANIEHVATLKEIGNLGWETPEDLIEPISRREIPYDVIVEVLSGRHDDRFDHWRIK